MGLQDYRTVGLQDYRTIGLQIHIKYICRVSAVYSIVVYFLVFCSRSESNNGNDYNPSSYGGNSSNSSTLERSSYHKPASRSNSSNLFSLDNSTDNNNSEEKPSRYSSSFTEQTPTNSFSRKNSMDLNGIADMTRKINETLARHGLDEKKTIPSFADTYEPKTSYNNGRLSETRG